MSQSIFRKKAMEKLTTPERLDQMMSITTPRGWLALLALGSLVVAAVLWATLATIPTTVSGEGILSNNEQDASRLDAILYTTVWDGMRIQPGMAARVSPVTVTKEEYGLMVGRVTSVKPEASTYADMGRMLRNDALAQSLASAGKLIEVRVELESAPDTASGYRWTTVQGPPTPVQSGTICKGTLVIKEERPIELVFSR
jgi:hypothetical protein